jgi:hypothetical protein
MAGATKAMVSVSGYLIGAQEAGKMPLPPQAEFEWWYQFYFATERGRAGYEKYRREFFEADLADRFPQVAVRRRHVQSQLGKESVRNTGSPKAWSAMINRTPARDGPDALGWRRGS